MGRMVDDFTNSVIGGFLCWAAGGYGSYWLARLAWRAVISGRPGFFGHVLGVLAWVVVFIVGMAVFLAIWVPPSDRADFRKKTDPALKALEDSLENESRALDAACARARKRISSVNSELRKLN